MNLYLDIIEVTVFCTWFTSFECKWLEWMWYKFWNLTYGSYGFISLTKYKELFKLWLLLWFSDILCIELFVLSTYSIWENFLIFKLLFFFSFKI